MRPLLAQNSAHQARFHRITPGDVGFTPTWWNQKTSIAQEGVASAFKFKLWHCDALLSLKVENKRSLNSFQAAVRVTRIAPIPTATHDGRLGWWHWWHCGKALGNQRQPLETWIGSGCSDTEVMIVWKRGARQRLCACSGNKSVILVGKQRTLDFVSVELARSVKLIFYYPHQTSMIVRRISRIFGIVCAPPGS
jgi:hypothetical protein